MPAAKHRVGSRPRVRATYSCCAPPPMNCTTNPLQDTGLTSQRVRLAGPPQRYQRLRLVWRDLGAQRLDGGGVTLDEEGAHPVRLVVLADGAGRLAQRVQGAQEPAIRLLRPRDRPVALPAGAA